MPSQLTAGTVVYAKELTRMASFYAAVTGLEVAHSDADYVVLQSATFQLVIVQISEAFAASIEVADPPVRREDAALKPVFVVARLAASRAVVSDRGGQLDPPEGEWRFGHWVVCDGHDPEGNVIQLRQAQA